MQEVAKKSARRSESTVSIGTTTDHNPKEIVIYDIKTPHPKKVRFTSNIKHFYSKGITNQQKYFGGMKGSPLRGNIYPL